MADVFIDGAKLDACNTAEADAIRAKTGGADPIPYDYANNKGFADAIAAIPSSTMDYVQQYADSTASFYFDQQIAYNCPDPLIFNFPNATKINIFPNTRNCPATHVELYIKDALIDTGNIIGSSGFSVSGVTHLKIRCGNSNILRKNNKDVYYLLNCDTLKYCDFVLDLSQYNYGIYTAWFGPALEEIRFSENSIKPYSNHNIGVYYDPPFSDASIISLANGLQAGAGTITVGAKIKARIESNKIIGNVNDGVFVADENGTVTIADFITNIKGWTVA